MWQVGETGDCNRSTVISHTRRSEKKKIPENNNLSIIFRNRKKKDPKKKRKKRRRGWRRRKERNSCLWGAASRVRGVRGLGSAIFLCKPCTVTFPTR